MKLRIALPILILAFASIEGCATAPPQGSASTTTPRRRRQRAAHPANAAAQPPAPAGIESVPSGLALVPATSRATEHRSDGGAMEARTTSHSFGTPVLHGSNDLGELHAQVVVVEGQTRVRCDGTQPSLVPSTQSPYEPGSAAIVRTYLPVERGVIACRPAANPRGRLPTRAVYASNGAPAEFTFPGVSLTRQQATCVGEALCAARMPTFRAPTATVDYEVLVYLAQSP
jgi:hypothetical protein